MRLLLTSAGITNPSLHAALVGLLDRPIDESRALLISTASYPLRAGPELAWNFLAGKEPRTPMGELGWRSLGVLELTAIASLEPTRWRPAVEAADVFLVNGGDAIYLDRWMRESGLAALLPELRAVYVGLSAGSLVMGPSIDDEFAAWTTPVGGEGLGVVDFTIFPHLDHPDLPENTSAHAERWAERLTTPGYAIDDATGIRVVDGAVEVVSEGRWRRFEPPPRAGGSSGG